MTNILKTLELTQEEYNNLEVKDNDTMYITESNIYIGSTLMTDRVKLLNEIAKVQQEVDTIDESVDNLKENTVSSINGQTGDVIITIPDTSKFATKTELSNEVQELNDKIDSLPSGGSVSIKAGQNITITNSDTINAEGYRVGTNNNFIINDVTNNKANSQYNFVQGYKNTINTNSNNSMAAGSNGIVSHSNSFLFGDGLKSVNPNCTVIGRYNNPQDNWNAVLWIGMGSSDTDRKNELIIQNNEIHYRGRLKEGSGWMGDIGEYFEWYDGNILDEDRVGYMVQLKDGKIEYATDIDNCIGVVSDTCILTGGACSLEWHGMYLKDKFGRDIYEEVDGEMIQVKNPNYDESLVYISRDKRKEWCKVGIIGQVIVRQDGTLVSGGFAGCKDGIATKSTEKTSYRVVKVIDETVAIILVK